MFNITVYSNCLMFNIIIYYFCYKARNRYKLDAGVAKASKLITID